MGNMFCAYCGAPLNPYYRTKCEYCGQAQEINEPNPYYSIELTYALRPFITNPPSDIIDKGTKLLLRKLAQSIDYKVIDYPVSGETKIIFYLKHRR